MIPVSVVYAKPEQQINIPLTVNPGCTAEQAIRQSGLLQQCSEIDLTTQAIGVFGQKVTLAYIVQADDRIEIYRPLIIDPRDVRMKKVKAERRKKH